MYVWTYTCTCIHTWRQLQRPMSLESQGSGRMSFLYIHTYVYTRMYVCMNIYLYINIYLKSISESNEPGVTGVGSNVYLYVCVYIYTHIYICMYIYIYIYIYTHYKYMYISIYAHTYICMHKHIPIHIFIYLKTIWESNEPGVTGVGSNVTRVHHECARWWDRARKAGNICIYVCIYIYMNICI